MRYLLTIWFFRVLRFGPEVQTKFWKNKILSGSEESDSGVIIWGGLSANAAQAHIQIARLFYTNSDKKRDVWCLNISGHTGGFLDFTMSRAWHWIPDADKRLLKMTFVLKKKDVLLIGHSAGSLIALSLLVLFQIRSFLCLKKDMKFKFKAALLFPAFRLKSRLDEGMLFIVALLYYVICPLIFIYLGINSVKLLPLSVAAILLHFMLVPGIWIPFGDTRNPKTEKRWWMLSELMILSFLCIFFVTMPVVIILIHRILPAYSQIVMAVFLISLLSVLFFIPQKKASHRKSICKNGYDYLPIITATNVLLLQMLLRPFLKLVKAPVLILHSKADNVASVPESWVKDLSYGSRVTVINLDSIPHSQWTPGQQQTIYNEISKWEKGL